jgi:hypothetical protein
MRLLGVAIALVACGSKRDAPRVTPVATPVAGALRPVSAFDAIGDRRERSRALFVEASRVLLHARCVNCHPAGDTPHQGNALALHDPPVVRGPDDFGMPGNQCRTCHQDRNQELARVPGAPNWHLAPSEMAWVGKPASAICQQLRDPKRNGGKTLAQIADHSAHDELVGWGWAPGHGREPAPGTQEQFGALMTAWVATGAECPKDSQ